MKSLILLAAALCASTAASATTMLFDFGRTDMQTPGNWNNIVPATTTLNLLFDDGGNIVPSHGLEITDTFFQSAEPSSLGSEAPSGDAAGFPVTATDDYFFGHTTPFAGDPENPLGQLRLFNLDPTSLYTFTFFASRTGVADTRDALYTLLGSNSDSVVLDASNNETETARVFGIVPDVNNEIFVNVEPGPNNDNGNGFFYIGLMQVDIRPIPEPSAALGLLAGALIFGARRLGRRR